MSDLRSPKHIIYALVDPHTHQVRYVGRTSRGMAKRLKDHIGAAQRGVQKPYYDWIRTLLPDGPIIVCLQELDSQVGQKKYSSKDGWQQSLVGTAETKWMKRFERSQLLCVIPRDARAYRRL